jgi:hypothetical protein
LNRPTALVLASLLLSACGIAGGSGALDPAAPLVVAEDGLVVPYGAAIAGGEVFKDAKQPAPIELLPGAANCSRVTARRSAVAALVYSYGGGPHVPLQHVPYKDTPERRIQREAYLAAIRSTDVEFTGNSLADKAIVNEAAAFAAGNAVEWSSRIDVVVTETSAPVFLYLASYDPVFWNIQLAPGAVLDGVVVNSYDGGAIANGAPDARTNIIAFSDPASGKCWHDTWSPGVPASVRIKAAKELNPDFNAESYRREWEEEYRTRSQSYRMDVPRLVGKMPDVILMDARGGPFEAVLVGPPPAAPFPYQPVTRIQMPDYLTPYWGGRSDAMKPFGVAD